MNLRRIAFLAALLAVVPPGRGTETGLSADPMGAAWHRGAAGSAYAIWDVFPAGSFVDAPAGTVFGVARPAMDQTAPQTNVAMGAGLYRVFAGAPSTTPADNDVLFPGGNAVNFTLTGKVDFSIRGFTVQIKRPGNPGGLQADFAPTLALNGGPPIAFDRVVTTTGGGDTSSDGRNWSVTTWTWGPSLAGLPATAGDAFAVSFAHPGLHRGIDGIAIDAGSVAPAALPKAVTVASVVVGFGLAGLVLRARRRASGASDRQSMATVR